MENDQLEEESYHTSTLLNDTGLDNVVELRAAMIHRDTWR